VEAPAATAPATVPGSSCAALRIAANEGLEHTACRVITRILNRGFLSSMASYNEASL